MKSGSGDLDFGQPDSENESESDSESESETTPDATEEADSATDFPPDSTTDGSSPGIENPDDDTVSEPEPEQATADATDDVDDAQYPYFVRRRNVMDERDQRIELHLRESVANKEVAFRNALASELGGNEVSKTDAREFALKLAFQNPEGVAKLMKEEGYRAGD
ncbi:acyl-CoA dehydrogenase [Natronosalvus amylolyticus]|uniref:acyl-CoA dehydrogenase n=1 Tax=Natronosalvus amylolyticus TaxID=2961994 RepID=UPI0028803CC8|nr:acyl-CoA dehydrogenase [Natronosalvus amylolyticus]